MTILDADCRELQQDQVGRMGGRHEDSGYTSEDAEVPAPTEQMLRPYDRDMQGMVEMINEADFDFDEMMQCKSGAAVSNEGESFAHYFAYFAHLIRRLEPPLPADYMELYSEWLIKYYLRGWHC